MRISAKGEYAIRAMLDLAVHPGTGLVPIQEIARRQGVPQRYLEQVLLVLKRVGMVASKRGASGGYRLLCQPGAVSVGEILRAVEGRVTFLEVAGRGVPDGAGEGSDLAPLWREVTAAVAAVIDRTTLADLAEGVKARRAPHRAVYHI